MSVVLTTAFQTLVANKMRAGLTLLGTVIGVTCVIALWNIGESGRQYMSESLSSIGGNVLFVTPNYAADEEEAQRRERFRPLTLKDAAAIGSDCPSVFESSPASFAFARAVHGARFAATTVRGCYPSYLTIGEWKLASGTSFCDADVAGGNQVALLGAGVAAKLFGAMDPLGQRIRLGNAPFLVIGVLQAKGSFFGHDQDDVILAPFTAVNKTLTGSQNVSLIFVSVRGREEIESAKREIVLAVRRSQNLAPERKDPVEIRDLGEVKQTVDNVLLGLTAFLGAVGAVSMLVGGIGIMNIMLVSVSERTKEIGLRMAVGATEFNVLSQFLAEAAALSAVGGLIGALLGIGTAAGVGWIFGLAMKIAWPIVVQPLSIVVAVLFAAAVGIFFGFYPAWRAARLDPIEALRRN
jgi:putative ABC transport system permease protein